MRVIITIGYNSILLPDDTGVATIMKALSKGIRVIDRLYEGKVELADEGTIEVAMKYVPDNVQFIANGEPVKVFVGRKVYQQPTTSGQKQLGC